jgi:tetratricopeptide (TPR) repeat protein
VYIDEVQDFTYASIFLICKIGGRESLSWTCAGDTAQMISPGCSFKFAGLKQTLLAVREGIEARLSSVCHLLVNYRTTRDVLILGNAILNVAKQHFPGAIEYAQPEISVKDEGCKVRLTDWDEAFRTKVAFGPNQALIYSHGNSSEVKDAAVSWLKDHPFVLSSLESKGLEFDDVVISFDMGRKVWNMTSENVACLRMLRELYVAVTRAKRRVIILVKKSLPAMSDFFESLGCDLERVRASTAFLEFDTQTSPETWLKKGHNFFEDEKYDLAAGCFHAARSDGWSFWAQGLHLKRNGNKDDALSSFRLAARAFLDQSEYKYTLDIMVLIRALPPWSPEDTAIYDEARRNLPEHFPRVDIVHFALVQDRWEVLTVGDMVEPSTATLLIAYRKHEALQNMLQQCTEADRIAASALLPTIVGDCYFTSGRYSDAVKLYLKGNDQASAERATEVQLASSNGNTADELLLESVSYWEGVPKPKRKLTPSSATVLLLQLFESPASTAATSASKSLTILGAKVIKLAIRRSTVDEIILHDFHPTVFQKEVLAALEAKHNENLFEIVKWYTNHDDLTNATDYANKYIKTWSEKELIAIVTELRLFPGGLLREFGRRDMLLTAVDLFLRAGHEYLSSAVMASDMALSSPAKVEQCGDELLIVWGNANAANTTKALAESKASKISAFLHLFHDTPEASRTRAKECLKLFGKITILKAVFGSRIYKKEVIKSVLARFQEKSFNSLCLMDMIHLFRDFGLERASAQEFVHANLSEWTNTELSDIVCNETSVRSPAVVEELARRGLFLLCMEIALEEKNIPEALRHADCELSVTVVTWGNVMPTFTLWRRFIEPGDSVNTVVLARSSKFSALLRLREDALSVMRSDKAFHFVASYGPSFVGYAIRFNGMPDDFAAFAGIKVFHENLRKSICEKVAAQRMKCTTKKIAPMSISFPDPKVSHAHEQLMAIQEASFTEDTDAGSRLVAKDRDAGDLKKKSKRRGKKKKGKR